MPIVVSADGEWLYVQGAADLPAQIAACESAQRRAASRCGRCCRPTRPARWSILRIVMTPDARAYVYTFIRALSALYLVDGLR